MLKADAEHKQESRDFDYKWIFGKVNTTVSGLNTKVNLRVLLHDAISNFILLKQQAYKPNDGYLTRFKFMVNTLKIAGGEHILASEIVMGETISVATKGEIDVDKDKCMSVCLILRSDDMRYKKLNDDLKSSANWGRDEYLKTLTDAFNLIVRESGKYDTGQSTI